MEEKLRTNRDALLDQYNDNLAATRDIQHTLVHDVLPSVVDELALDSDAQQWAKDFLLDTRKCPRIQSCAYPFFRSVHLPHIEGEHLAI